MVSHAPFIACAYASTLLPTRLHRAIEISTRHSGPVLCMARQGHPADWQLCAGYCICWPGSVHGGMLGSDAAGGLAQHHATQRRSGRCRGHAVRRLCAVLLGSGGPVLQPPGIATQLRCPCTPSAVDNCCTTAAAGCYEMSTELRVQGMASIPVVRQQMRPRWISPRSCGRCMHGPGAFIWSPCSWPSRHQPANRRSPGRACCRICRPGMRGPCWG